MSVNKLQFDESIDREAIKQMTTKRLSRYLIAGDRITIDINGESMNFVVPVGKTLHLRVIANIK